MSEEYATQQPNYTDSEIWVDLVKTNQDLQKLLGTWQRRRLQSWLAAVNMAKDMGEASPLHKVSTYESALDDMSYTELEMLAQELTAQERTNTNDKNTN